MTVWPPALATACAGAPPALAEPPPVPLMPGAWTALSARDTEALLDAIEIETSSGTAGTGAAALAACDRLLAARWLPLPCHPGWLLVEFDLLVRPGLRGTCDLVWGPDVLQWVDGRSGWLAALNSGRLAAGTGRTRRRPALRLDTAERAVAYLYLHCGCVWSGDDQWHSFRIVETPEAPALHGAAPGDWAATLGPVQVRPGPDGAGWWLECSLLHGGSLHAVRWALRGDGVLLLLADTLTAPQLLPPEVLRPPLRSLVNLE